MTLFALTLAHGVPIGGPGNADLLVALAGLLAQAGLAAAAAWGALWLLREVRRG